MHLPNNRERPAVVASAAQRRGHHAATSQRLNCRSAMLAMLNRIGNKSALSLSYASRRALGQLMKGVQFLGSEIWGPHEHGPDLFVRS